MTERKKLAPDVQKRLLAIASQKDPASDKPLTAQQRHMQALRECRDRLHAERPRFQPGDLVRFRKQLRNTKFPKHGETMVVVEVLQTPIWWTDHDAHLPYFRTPMDIVLGDVHNGVFMCWHYDSRRFEKVPADEL